MGFYQYWDRCGKLKYDLLTRNVICIDTLQVEVMDAKVLNLLGDSPVMPRSEIYYISKNTLGEIIFKQGQTRFAIPSPTLKHFVFSCSLSNINDSAVAVGTVWHLFRKTIS